MFPCCFSLLLLTVDPCGASSLPVREGFWRRPFQPHISEAASCGSKEMWCHIDAANLSVREKTQSGFTESLLAQRFSTFSSCSDLRSMAADLAESQNSEEG